MKRATAEQRYRSNTRTGLILGGLLLVILYLAFGGGIPFRGGYDIHAIVSNATELHSGSPVRIAGVNVGKVTGVTRGPGTTADVKMRIQDAGRPIHSDATLKVRPRLFLEGNFFVDLEPGTPSAPDLKDDGTIPLSQTAVPVQFDQVLSTLTADPRAALKTLLKEYDTALSHGGAQAINRTFKPSGPALRGIALVSQESLGLHPHDVSNIVSSFEKLSSAIARNHDDLSSLLTNFNRTVAAFADNEADVSTGTRDLGALAKVSYPALGAINDALPSLRRFSVNVRPLLRRSPRTLDLTLPLLRQLKALFGKRELPPLLTDLNPSTRSLARIEPKLKDLLPKVTRVSQCVTGSALPTLNSKLDDGALSSGMTVWQEILSTNVGLASADQSFDGNGHHIRYEATGGENLVSVGKLPGVDTLYAALQQPLLGSRPRQAAKPPFHPDVSCNTQAKPNLKAATTPPPVQRRVKTRKVSPDVIKKLLTRARKQFAAGRKAAR